MKTTVIVTSPAATPISVSEAKSHINIADSFDEDDILIESMVESAVSHCESVTRRRFITQTWDLFIDEWPGDGIIKIPYGSLQEVTSVSYLDDAGNAHTLSSGDYAVDTKSPSGCIALLSGKSWPAVKLWPVNAISVRFTCGYGTSGDDVPQPIRRAILIQAATEYQLREDMIYSGQVQHLRTVDRLLWPYRLMGF